jgi:hypothetical protein
MNSAQQDARPAPVRPAAVRDIAAEEGVRVLQAAQRVTASLREERPQTEVARRADGPVAYGIGTMLFKLVEKGHLEDEEVAFRLLSAQVRRGPGKGEDAAPVNRRTVIATLRKFRMINPELSVRAIKPSGSTPNIHQIIRVTEENTKITAEEILSRNRSRPIVDARFSAMWALRTVSGTSFSVIGEHFGGKDHTTVINAVNQIDLKRLSDNGLKRSTDQIADAADLIGIRSNMDLLTRTAALRAV